MYEEKLIEIKNSVFGFWFRWTLKERRQQMKTTNFADRKTSIRLVALYCLELVFRVALAGCTSLVLWDFNQLEKEALKYGTVSVGAVRVTDYNEEHLEGSRKRLRLALEKIQKHLANEPITPSQKPPAATEDTNKKADKAQDKKAGKAQDKENDKAQAPWPYEIEAIGLRMAALKFVESELEDINLGIVSPNKPGFRRVVVSLDCSAWVRGEAGAALVYIDLYPYEADSWCHEAAKVLESFSKGSEKAMGCKEGTKCREE